MSFIKKHLKIIIIYIVIIILLLIEFPYISGKATNLSSSNIGEISIILLPFSKTSFVAFFASLIIIYVYFYLN